MKVEEPDLAGTYSYGDYVTWTWDEMVELIKGKIYRMSPNLGIGSNTVILEEEYK